MIIDIRWQGPFRIVKDTSGELDFTVENLNKIPEEYGVYIIVSKTQNKTVPIYVGLSNSIRKRIKGHLNSVKRNKQIKHKHGDKEIFVGILEKPSPNATDKKREKAIDICETAIIRHFLAQGFNLINDKKTKPKVHEIYFYGNRKIKEFTGPNLFPRAG